MNEQIAFRSAADLHPIAAEAEFRGNAYGLAVAVHEDAAGQHIHRVIPNVCTQ